MASTESTTPAPAAAGTHQASLTELVSGIVGDAQKLFNQQIAMLRSEVKEDLKRTREAAQYVGLGVAVALVGVLFLAISSVYLIQHFAQLPTWACWAIVGGVLTGGGLIAAYVGKRLFDSFNPLPDKTANAVQENLTWIATNPQS